MPLEPGESLPVAVAALLGGALGWWPLAAWARRSMLRTLIALPATDSASPLVAGSAARPARAQPARAWPARALPVRALPLACAALTAVGWGLVVWRLGLQPVLPAALAFVAAGSVLTIVDAAEHRLPNRVLRPASLAVAALLVLAAAVSGQWPALLWAAAGSAGMFAAYLLVVLASPSAMGMGDVKLAGLIGLLLGWFGLEAWLIGLAAAFVIGGLVAVAALTLRRVTLRGALPFGPSMLAGAVLSVLLGG